jgi:hypothetical protein
LFDLAKGAFEEAQRLDPGYAPAWVNMAGLLALKNPKDRHATAELEDAADRLKDYPALEPAVSLAKRVLAGETQPPGQNEDHELEGVDEEQIGNLAPASLLKRRATDEGIAIEGSSSLRVGPAREYDDGYTTLLVQRGGKRLAMIAALPSYKGKTSRGAGVGTSLADVQKAYCEAGGTSNCGVLMDSANGKYLHLRKSRAVFLIDAQGRVARWFLYAGQ